MSRGALKTSDKFKIAEVSAPTTNPSCTASVSQAVMLNCACQSLASSGKTAVPANHTETHNNSASASSKRMRCGLAVVVTGGKLGL
jgi:hypothetical protein